MGGGTGNQLPPPLQELSSLILTSMMTRMERDTDREERRIHQAREEPDHEERRIRQALRGCRTGKFNAAAASGWNAATATVNLGNG
jgi:hypothetical protein